MPAPRRFEFAWDARYRAAARTFGIRPERAWVEVSDDDLLARFGRWRLQTPRANITATELTGPFHFLKTAGPPRLGVTDRGLSFASNGRRGALLTFNDPVAGIEPRGWLRHPELTVTVADPEGLLRVLRSSGPNQGDPL